MARTQQDQIIAQSQLKLTLEYFSACGHCPSLADLIKISTMLEKYVKEGYSSTLAESFDKIDEYINSNYKG
jgi:hypothetical protein